MENTANLLRDFIGLFLRAVNFNCVHGNLFTTLFIGNSLFKLHVKLLEVFFRYYSQLVITKVHSLVQVDVPLRQSLTPLSNGINFEFGTNR